MTAVSSQIAAAHTDLIRTVAEAVRQGEPTEPARARVARYREDGWNGLADALEARLDGRKTDSAALDDEDRGILEAVERTAGDPAWLDAIEAEAENEAAEQIAALILAATWGEREALAALNEMRDTAEQAGLSHSAAHAFVAIVEGERDPDRLVETFPHCPRGLAAATLEAVARQETA